MQSGDGLLVRVRTGAAPVSSKNIRDLVELATQYGNGQLELTRRGNVQLRGVHEWGLGALQGALVACGLGLASAELEARLALTADPLSGLDSRCARIDALAALLSSALLAAPGPWRLPPKFGVVLDGGSGALDHVSADIRVRVEPDAPERACLFAAGCAADAVALGSCCTVDAPRALLVLIAHLADASSGGQRMRDVIAARGTAPLHAALGDLLRAKPAACGVVAGAPCDAQSRDVSDEVARTSLHAATTRPLVGYVPPQAAPAQNPAVCDSARDTRYGARRVGRDDGAAGDVVSANAALGYVGLGLAFGAGDVGLWRRLADWADTYAGGAMRVTASRSVLLAGVRPDRARALLYEARAAGLIVEPDDPLLRVEACPGAPACSSAHGETRGLARTLVQVARPLLRAHTTLHVSGCKKACAHSGAAGLTVVHSEAGVHLGFDCDAGRALEAAPGSVAHIERLLSVQANVPAACTQESLGP